MDARGDLDADTLLKIILILVAIWLVFEIVGEILHILGSILGPLRPLLGLAILLLIVLWLLDRL
jgi:uncharacterized membrane protein required for colicin V production